MKKFILSAVAVILASAAAANPVSTRSAAVSSRHWVDSVFNSLSPRERVAQLFVPAVNPAGQGASGLVTNYIGKNGMGGLLFSEGTLKQYRDIISHARKSAKVPPLITFDGEWGLSMRIEDTPKFPSNIALGAIRDVSLLKTYGSEVGREFNLIGVNVNFAPVADVNTNPANPVIGYRSFGENPLRVADDVVEYSMGLQMMDVMAVAKHFPGHGDTNIDSHKALPVDTHSAAEIEATHLLPFEKFIAAGGAGVMTAHLSVPALDPTGIPASLSSPVTTTLLRDRLGFTGLIFTDALAMKGAKTASNNCVAALKAGADICLMSASPVSDLNAVMNAVAKGELSQASLDAKCRRVLEAKYALGLSSPRALAPLSEIQKGINSPEAEAVNILLSDACVTLLSDPLGLVPASRLDSRKFHVCPAGGTPTHFTATANKYIPVNTITPTAKTDADDVVLIPVLSDRQSAVETVRTALSSHKNCVVIFLINPFRAAKFADVLKPETTVMFAYDLTPALQNAAAKGVFGGITVNGQFPVNIRGLGSLGQGLVREKTRLGRTSPVAEGLRADLTFKLDSILKEGIAAGAFPGCQLLVAKNGNVVYDRAMGTQTMHGNDPVTENTIYDLASVSKATGTLPGIMKAYDLGLFNLDSVAAAYIPGLRDSDKNDVTVRQLLFHETGIQPGLNMYAVMIDSASYTGPLTKSKYSAAYPIKIQKNLYGNRTARLRDDIVKRNKTDEFNIEASRGLYVSKASFDTIMNRIYHSPLRPTKDYTYSCLNFCLLMNMEQNITGQPHNVFVADSIFLPLGMTRTLYRPLEKYSSSTIAPTENDTFLRRQTLRGYVHDELANFSGGVSGNAGLFGTAGDLAKLCQMWLQGGKYGDRQVLSENTVELFTTTKSPTCRRGLGFDKPDTENPDNSPTCEEADPSVYGHIGFTGTIFWVDPKNEIIFVFLNNRVNPTRSNEAFSRMNLRPELFRQVYKAME